VILQIICVVTIVRYSKTHEAFFNTKTNEVIGKINTQYSSVNNYFKLTHINEQLALENAKLREQLKSNFILFDSTPKISIDTLIKDTLNRYRKYTYLLAEVVGNSVSEQYNFIQLQLGSKQGVKKDMGVLGPIGIVGKIVNVGENYCEVMSLLNRSSKVSAVIKNGKEFYASSVSWNGKDANYLTMENVSRAIAVKKGDSIVTSSYSPSFPSQLLIGTVAEVKPDAAGNNLTLTINSATDFNKLQYVNIIVNAFYEQQKGLSDTTLKNHLKAMGE
jgi:rod shape-determining protein MreC